LLREIVARFPQAACRVKVLHFPEMPGFLSKQAGLVVDYFNQLTIVANATMF